MIECPNKDSCIGGTSSDNSQSSTCSTGYEGILCQDCSSGYGKSALFIHECEDCSERNGIGVLLLFYWMGVSIAWYQLMKVGNS